VSDAAISRASVHRTRGRTNKSAWRTTHLAGDGLASRVHDVDLQTAHAGRLFPTASPNLAAGASQIGCVLN